MIMIEIKCQVRIGLAHRGFCSFPGFLQTCNQKELQAQSNIQYLYKLTFSWISPNSNAIKHNFLYSKKYRIKYLLYCHRKLMGAGCLAFGNLPSVYKSPKRERKY